MANYRLHDKLFSCPSRYFDKDIAKSPSQSIIAEIRQSSMITIHADKFFRNLIKSNRNQIVFTIFRLIYNQTEYSLYPNQWECGIYNQTFVDFATIRSRFLFVFIASNYRDKEKIRNLLHVDLLHKIVVKSTKV